MSEWISVDDQIASEHEEVLGCQSRNGIMATGRFKNGVFTTGCGAMDYVDGVTHWMPLPKPPESNQ